MPIDVKDVKQIFLGAVEQADDAARAAYLDRACGGDAGLRARVEALLRSHDTAGSFLGTPAAVAPAPDDGETAALDAPDSGGSPGPGGEGLHGLQFLTAPGRPDSLGRIGHYEVLEVLGRGGFGVVFRAFDESLQRVVAIKALNAQIAATSPARKRFLREARSSARVRHENIVQVYAVEEQPLPFLVMEFIPGENLQQRIDRTGPLETPEVLRIGRQIAEGLAAAHSEGIIHRDIKPANILIEAGPGEHVKITDFGLARAADDASVTQSGVVAGTPMFMAPEQAHGGKLDHRADLFSLGSVLYTMLSGRPPFRANGTLAVLKRVAEDTPRPIPEIIPEAPPWLCEIIERLHAKKPEDRYATAREVADLLGRMPAAGRPDRVVPNAPSPKIPEAAASVRRPRSPVRLWAAVAAVPLLLLAILGSTEATGVTDLHGTVVRLFSPEGTLEVQVDDPAVSVQIDGSDIVITGAGAKEICLKPGSYTVKGVKDGKVVSRELVTVTREGKQVVRVSREAGPVAPAKEVAAPVNNPDRRAAEYALSAGGTVMVNGQDQEIKAVADLPRDSFRLTGIKLWNDNGQVSVTAAGLAAFDGCTNLTAIITYGVDLGEAALAHFKDSKNLTMLTLEISGATDAGLAAFKECKNLTFLRVTLAPMTDAGVAHFKDCKKLTYLSFFGTQVGDAVLTPLAGFDQLAEVNLGMTNVTAKGVEGLAKALPKCKIEWQGGVIEPK